MVDPTRAAEVAGLLGRTIEWAKRRPDVRGLALVGSEARGLFAAALMGAVGAGCADNEAAEAPPADLAAVERCGESDVRKLVAAFVDAFNAGDLTELDRLVAPADAFRWYTVDGPGRVPGERGATGGRGTLISYFSRRHARGERLEFSALRFHGSTVGYGNFSYALHRRAHDLAPTPYFGKGAAICTSGENMIIVWSMGTGRRG